MNSPDKKYAVQAIQNGTVIDHIPSSALFEIIRILQLDRETHRITFGSNLQSKRMGSKAIIKIDDRYPAPEELNRIALLAPQAMINIIEDFAVVEKRQVVVPEQIEGFVRCANPRCITNNEPMETSFEVIGGEQVALRCRYCEKVTHRLQLKVES